MTGKIIGTGSYIPDTRWDNNVLAGMMDTSDEWVMWLAKRLQEPWRGLQKKSFLSLYLHAREVQECRREWFPLCRWQRPPQH